MIKDKYFEDKFRKQNTAKKITICHWNLNSIAGHNFAKLVLLKAYNSVYKFDIICLSETYLDSNILPDDSNLKIPGYNLVRSDHPSNKKRGGACIYYKSYLPLRIIDINYLSECVRFELMVGDKLCNFIALYRSPSQSQDLFESFKENLELNLESAVQNNPFLVVLLGDFNAKSSNWCKNDTTTTEGKAIENITSQFGLHQMTDEPTHTLESSSSCIDLIFTSQPNLITESGSIHLYILILITRSFLQNLTWKFTTHHLIFVKSGTIKMQILILSDEQLLCLIGIELF